MSRRQLAIAHRTVTVIGRLGGLPWVEAAAKVAAAGGSLRRGLSRRTNVVVVGHGAHELLASGRLDRRLAQARQPKTLIVSENVLLRALGATPPLPEVDRPFTIAQVAQQTKLSEATVTTLALLDVLELDSDSRGAFRDLVAARAVARRLSDGTTLSEILAAVHRRAGSRSARIAGGDVAHIGAAFAEDQMRLPLGDGGNLSADDLFESAYVAEEDSALETAESLYRRCLHADRRDPTAAFNLANVLVALGRAPEARIQFGRVLAIDSKFVEARYNLAHLLEGAGEIAGAKEQLLAALKIDREYADAQFNLATLLTREGDLAAAIPCWERYLYLDGNGEWAEKARQSLSLCQRLARAEDTA